MNKTQDLKNQKEDLIRFLKGEDNTNGQKLFDKYTSIIMSQCSNNEVSDNIGVAIRNQLMQKIEKQNKISISKFITLKQVLSRAAAIIAILITIGGLTNLLINKYGNDIFHRSVVMINIKVPFGEKKIVKLADGSIVHLNSGSEILFPENFSKSTRNIKLKGEAFFDVARNPQKPFIIESGNITTKVLGTAFNIKAYADNNPTVTVTRGKVMVTVMNPINKRVNIAKVYLAPGEQTLFDRTTYKFKTQRVNSEKYISWQDNILHYDNEPILNVFKDIERTYNIKINCYNKTILNSTIKTSFNNVDINTVLENLKFILNFQYTFDKGKRIAKII